MPPPDALRNRIRQRLAYIGAADAASIPDDLVEAVAAQYEKALSGYAGSMSHAELFDLMFPLPGAIPAKLPAELRNARMVISEAESNAADVLQAEEDPDAAWKAFVLSQKGRLTPSAQFQLGRAQNKAKALAAWTLAPPGSFLNFLLSEGQKALMPDGALRFPLEPATEKDAAIRSSLLQSLMMEGKVPASPTKEWMQAFNETVKGIGSQMELAAARQAAVSQAPADPSFFPFGPPGEVRQADFVARAVAEFPTEAAIAEQDDPYRHWVSQQGFAPALESLALSKKSAMLQEWQKSALSSEDPERQGQTFSQWLQSQGGAGLQQVLAPEEKPKEFEGAFMEAAARAGLVGEKANPAVDSFVKDRLEDAERAYSVRRARGEKVEQAAFIQSYIAALPSAQQIETQLGPRPPGFGNLEGAIVESERRREEKGLIPVTMTRKTLPRMPSGVGDTIAAGTLPGEGFAPDAFEPQQRGLADMGTPPGTPKGKRRVGILGQPQEMGTDILAERFGAQERRALNEAERIRLRVLQAEALRPELRGRTDFLDLLERETRGSSQTYQTAQYQEGREAGARTLSAIPREYLGTAVARQTVQQSFASAAFDPGGFRRFLEKQIAGIKEPILKREGEEAAKQAAQDLFERQNRPRALRVRRIA